MPTTDPITTDRLAAAIHTGMADQPLLATHTRPVADRLAVLIRKRLPNITAADTGELMIHLGAFLSDVMAALTEEGESPASAVLIATSAIAIAGVELHDTREGRADSDRTATEAAARISVWRNQLNADARAWFQRNEHPIPDPLHQPDDDVPCNLGCGTDLRADDGSALRLLLADLDAVLDELERLEQERDAAVELLPDTEQEDFDTHAVQRVLGAVTGVFLGVLQRPTPPLSDAIEALADAANGLGDRFADRITDLAARTKENPS